MAMTCGKKTNLPFSSAKGHDDPQIWVRKQIFRFVSQQIHCGHSCLSESRLSVLCNSVKGCVLWPEWLVYLFHLWKQDVNFSNANKYKTFGDALSCGVAGQNFIFLRYLLQVLVIWILNVANSSNTFPGKYFVQHKLILNLNTFSAGYNLFIASSTAQVCRSLSDIRANLFFNRAIRTPPK